MCIFRIPIRLGAVTMTAYINVFARSRQHCIIDVSHPARKEYDIVTQLRFRGMMSIKILCRTSLKCSILEFFYSFYNINNRSSYMLYYIMSYFRLR